MSGERSILIKFLAGFLIISGAYSIPHGIIIASKFSKTWTEENKLALIKKCLKDSGQTAKKYPKFATEYCICSIENITKNIPKDEYLALLKKSLRDQLDAQYKYFEDCLDELNLSIKRLESSKKM